MNPAPEERRLGEYRLREFLAENSVTRTWIAEQTSIGRLVLLDELRPDQPGEMENFLADVRAKAAVDHPLISSVYEASAEPGQCYYAHELLPGVTLATRVRAAEPLLPARLAHLLRRVAEAQLQHEALGHATSPLTLHAIHLDEHGVVRLGNLAIAGARAPDESVRDLTHLGTALVPLVADGQPGATRLLTLLGWMRGDGLEAPITWSQTRDFCLQIEHQLADPLSIVSPTKAALREGKKRPVTLIATVTGLALLSIVVLAMKMRPPVTPAPPRPDLPGPVTIPGGSHRTPDGAEKSHPTFRLAAHETTIGQYAEFLDTLAVLAKDQRGELFDHPTQPAEKTDHIPADWATVFAAAKAGTTLTLDTPVTGIDWWDAAAYAEWKNARLPTQDEWFAALTTQVEVPAAIPASSYGSVTAETTDRTPTGLLGMAGSVCEWTADRAPNPANPLGEKFWVITGGSHLKPGSNALSREWIADQSLRRPDLGFRILLPGE
jgi:formylglycine-generating enzyme required for sulfatase activity